MSNWTQSDVDAIRNRRQAVTGKRNKYHAVKTTVDGIVFDSKREAQRWHELQLLVKAGEITALERQRSYALVVNETYICSYVCDFVYHDKHGNLVVEDAKGVRTPVYRLKAKLMEALHRIIIREV